MLFLRFQIKDKGILYHWETIEHITCKNKVLLADKSLLAKLENVKVYNHNNKEIVFPTLNTNEQ